MMIPWDTTLIPDDPTPTPEARQLADAWGRFIYGLAPWAWWAGFTFRLPVSKAVAGRAVKTFAKGLAKTIIQHVTVAWAIEPHPNGDGSHVHLLLAHPPTVTATLETLESLWFDSYVWAGQPEIKPYNPSLRAAWYMSKYLVETARPDIQVACPEWRACRRHGCIVAPGPWY